MLGAGIEQAAPLRVLAYRVNEIITADATHDLRPALSVVVGAIDVWSAVVALIVLRREICRPRIVRRRVDEADARELRQPRWRDTRPALAAVARDVGKAIVASRPNKI